MTMIDDVSMKTICDFLKSVRAQLDVVRSDVSSIEANTPLGDNRVDIIQANIALLSDRMVKLEGHVEAVVEKSWTTALIRNPDFTLRRLDE